MAAVLVLGIVTPVFSSPGDQALKRAKRAKVIAKNARTTANQALAEAQQAKQLAQGANDRLDALAVRSAREDGVVASDNAIGDYEALGGPAVEVTVPASGLIEVWGQAEILEDDGGTVALFEDGQPVPRLSSTDFCGDDSALFTMFGGGPSNFTPVATPSGFSPLGCASVGAPAPILVETTPGQHTYEMRYSECVCGDEAEFRNRILRIAPKP